MGKNFFFFVFFLLLSACSTGAPEKPVVVEKMQPYKNIDTINFERDVPIFMFHYVKDVSPEEKEKNTLHYRLSYSPEKFENMLRFFEKNNITPITFYELKDVIEKKKKMPKNPVILTFDDGYIDHYTNAFRILENFQMKGVFFVVSGNPGKKWYTTWEDIEKMSNAGHEIGSHTVSHADLTSLSDAMLTQELLHSKQEIEKHIHKSVISFCYPSGRHDERVVREVKKYYTFARTTRYGKHFSVQKRFTLPTLRIQVHTGEKQLREWLLK